MRGFVRDRTFVFLTDSAVGAREEHNLRHLVINLGTDVPRDYVVPFLTTKHTLDFCLSPNVMTHENLLCADLACASNPSMLA